MIRGVDVPFADWYMFDARQTSDSGEAFVSGQSTGDSIVVAQWFSEGEEYVMLDRKSTNDWYYEFVMNKETMVGSYWILGPNEDPTGSGSEFVGYRLGQQEIPSAQAAVEKLQMLEMSEFKSNPATEGAAQNNVQRFRMLKAWAESKDLVEAN